LGIVEDTDGEDVDKPGKPPFVTAFIAVAVAASTSAAISSRRDRGGAAAARLPLCCRLMATAPPTATYRHRPTPLRVHTRVGEDGGGN